ncbi:MAG: Cytidylate kinase [Chlamydiae bacterium]|nr:Cytidylate kinase [Chlamydiota bacterium]
MKIVILGTTGSGKTTLARKISKELGIPHVELDALNWDPNWQQVDDVLFRDRVKEAISGEKWVVDGNYSRAGHDLIWPRADVAIWLDYPLPVILWRLLKRVTRRAFTKEILWSGCQESLRRQFLSRESIFLWAFKSYRRRRRIYPYLLSKCPHMKLIRVRSPQKIPNIQELQILL